MSVTEKYTSIMMQGFESAIIVNSKGDPAGQILVRYTKSDVGCNSETEVSFHSPFEKFSISPRDAEKRGAYDRSAVFDILTEHGARCYDWNGSQFLAGNPRDTTKYRRIDEISRFSDLTSFKIGNRVYRLLWIG